MTKNLLLDSLVFLVSAVGELPSQSYKISPMISQRNLCQMAEHTEQTHRNKLLQSLHHSITSNICLQECKRHDTSCYALCKSITDIVWSNTARRKHLLQRCRKQIVRPSIIFQIKLELGSKVCFINAKIPIGFTDLDNPRQIVIITTYV